MKVPQDVAQAFELCLLGRESGHGILGHYGGPRRASCELCESLTYQRETLCPRQVGRLAFYVSMHYQREATNAEQT